MSHKANYPNKKAIMTRHKLKSSKLLTDTIPNKEVTSRIRNAIHLQRIERENGNTFRAMFSTILPYLRVQFLVLSFVGILLYFLQSFHNSSSHSKLEVFVSWLSDNGAILHPNVMLKSYPEYGGYGLSTKLDGGGIQYYEELFRIPDTLILSREKIISKMSTNVPTLVKEDDDVVIAMQLMVECALGLESFYAPYLQVLPEEVPRLDFWDEESLSMLQDEHLASIARNSRRRLEVLWNQHGIRSHVHSMLQSTNSRWSSRDYETCFTFESFHRFVSIVGSRAMVLNGNKYLVPLPDMTNYAPQPHRSSGDDRARRGEQNLSFNLYHYFSTSTTSTARETSETRYMIVRTDRGTPSDQQIFENYGDNDNTLYLEMFGFLPHEQNDFHCAAININPSLIVKTSSPSPLVVKNILQQYFDNYPSACAYGDGTLSSKRDEDMFAFLALFSYSYDEEQHKCISALESSTVKDIYFDHDENIIMTCYRYKNRRDNLRKLIQDAATYTLSLKPTLLVDDSLELSFLERNSMSSPSFPYKRWVAVRFRIQEKIILENLMHAYTGDEDDTRRKENQQCEFDNDDTMKSLNQKIDEFNEFIDDVVKPPICHIKAAVATDGMRIGAVATENIRTDDIYLQLLPRVHGKDIILSSSVVSTGYDDFDILLHDYSDNSSRDMDKHTTILLLRLMYETFILRERSELQPYLQILPTIDEQKVSHVLWMADDDLDYLAGSDLRIEVLKYKQSVLNRFRSFMRNDNVVRLFGQFLTLDNFLWAHSIVDSRSIWWDGARHLVPMLDLVNCSAGPSRIHSTRQNEKTGLVETKAAMDVHKGDQIFENYGQPNYIYFLYHGFILTDNAHDCVLFNDIKILRTDPVAQNVPSMWAKLNSAGFYSINPTFCMNNDKSVDRLKSFIRVKYDVSSSSSSFHGNLINVENVVRSIIGARLVRLDSIKGRSEQSESSRMNSKKNMMLQQVENEHEILTSLWNRI